MRSKLNRLILVCFALAILLAAILAVWHEADQYLASKRYNLQATARIVGATISSAVAARDRDAVLAGLQAVDHVPGVIRIKVYDFAGSSLAVLGDTTRLRHDVDISEASSPSLVAMLWTQRVEMSTSISEGGETVGHIVFVADAADMTGQVLKAVALATTGSAVALLLGLVLVHQFERTVTERLAELAETMTEVGRTANLKLTREIKSNDEIGMLAMRFNAMIEEIRASTDAILAREDEIILRLSRAAEQRDDQTGQHVVRVAEVSRIVAEQLGLDESWISDLYRASPLHDVGKVSTPDSILFKQGQLDYEERRVMQCHAEAGYAILNGSNSSLVQLAAEIAISHHERWDGHGYPRGVAGEEIPLSGRITAVADVCDALLSVRSYKQPWSFDEVRSHLIENAGRHFDPQCVEALIARWSDLQGIYQHGHTRPSADRQSYVSGSLPKPVGRQS